MDKHKALSVALQDILTLLLIQKFALVLSLVAVSTLLVLGLITGAIVEKIGDKRQSCALMLQFAKNSLNLSIVLLVLAFIASGFVVLNPAYIICVAIMFYIKKIQSQAQELHKLDHTSLCKTKLSYALGNIFWLLIAFLVAGIFYALSTFAKMSILQDVFGLVGLGVFVFFRFIAIKSFFVVQNEKARLARILELLEKSINISLVFSIFSLVVGFLLKDINLFYLSSAFILLIMSVQKKELRSAFLASDLALFMRKLNLVRDTMLLILFINFALAIIIG